MHNKINSEIEHLRALSIILVMIAHYNYYFPFILEKMPRFIQTASFGVGVDLFFCISGYVVSKAYIDYFDDKKGDEIFWPKAISFWLKRIYRLLPSAWLWVAITLLLSLFFNNTGIFETPTQNIKSAISIMFFSANISHMYDILKPNNVYWSLSLEEQFYFIFPFFLFLIKKTKYRVLLLITIIVVQFMLTRDAFGNINEQYAASFRTDGFAWGILICIFSKTDLYKKINPKKILYSKIPLILIYFALIFTIILSPVYFENHGAGIVALTSAIFVWLASYGTENINSFYFERQLTWLGKHSYAIYLIHLVIIRLFAEIDFLVYKETGILIANFKYSMLLISVIMILYLSHLNYKYIENPLRKKGKIRADNFFLLKSVPKK